MNDIGKKPVLKWLPIDSLRVGQAYQRSAEGSASQKLINHIATHFCWDIFQVLTVVEKKDAKGNTYYHVIDGQHRFLGAKKNGNIKDVPCSLVTPQSRQEEAAYFTRLNQNRVRMHTVDLYHAAVAAGDKTAVSVDRICKSAGITICKSPFATNLMPPSHTQAVGTIQRAWREEIEEATIIRALKCLSEAYHDTKGQLRSRMIEAIIRLYDMNERSKVKVDDMRLKTVLAAVDAAEIEMSVRIQKGVYDGDVSLGIIDDLVGVYNNGLPMKQYIVGELA